MQTGKQQTKDGQLKGAAARPCVLIVSTEEYAHNSFSAHHVNVLAHFCELKGSQLQYTLPPCGMIFVPVAVMLLAGSLRKPLRSFT